MRIGATFSAAALCSGWLGPLRSPRGPAPRNPTPAKKLCTSLNSAPFCRTGCCSHSMTKLPGRRRRIVVSAPRSALRSAPRVPTLISATSSSTRSSSWTPELPAPHSDRTVLAVTDRTFVKRRVVRGNVCNSIQCKVPAEDVKDVLSRFERMDSAENSATSSRYGPRYKRRHRQPHHLAARRSRSRRAYAPAIPHRQR